MKGITIGEVARRTNVRASAIRYYERVGCYRSQYASMAGEGTNRRLSANCP